jgi:WD40 repeat protein
LATCGRDKQIYIYEADSEDMLLSSVDDDEFEFSCAAILSGHTQDVKFIKWHPTDNLLFSASYDNTIKCWEYSEAVDDWICKYTIQGHKSTVWQMAFDPSG